MKFISDNIMIIICLLALYAVRWGWEQEVKQLKVQLEEAPSKQTYQISATLEKFTRECYAKEGGSFPVITTEPYPELRLRCFQFWKGNSGSWTELEMNPTFALPTN